MAQAPAGRFSLTWSSMKHPPSLHTGSGCRKRHDGIFRPGVDWKHPIHPVESKIPQQPSHTRSHVLEVQVMTRAVFQGDARHPRLTRIDLPRVEIENRRPPLLAIDALEAAAEKRVGQQAEKAAA